MTDASPVERVSTSRSGDVAGDVKSLNGRWEFRQAGSTDDSWLPATVPGDVYTDLEDNDVIPDPTVADNELDVQWVAKTDWVYRRTFEVDEPFVHHDVLELECFGLDTVAEVSINGTTVVESETMYRKHAADVGAHVRAGENMITIKFRSPVDYATERRDAHAYEVPALRYPVDQPARNFIRKAQCHFGWDWGPCLPGVGIWRDVRLVGYTAPRVESVTVEQTHADGDVTLHVRAALTVPNGGRYAVRAAVPEAAGAPETVRTVDLRPGEATVRLDVDVEDPDRWWPNGYGDQPLYDLRVSAFDAERDRPAGPDLDGRTGLTRRIGFREINLVREADGNGETFRFEVNGEPIFAKGANWIPAEPTRGRLEASTYDDLLTSAAAANMNMIRVWGGGYYELDAFYERCDELGLLVWQDFMFSCALYPADDAFVDRVEREARYQTRRLSTHPSLAVWCGNNENEMSIESWFDDEAHIDQLRADYEQLMDSLGDVVAQEDPERSFWPGSPSSGAGEYAPDDETRGDIHFWDVWHDGASFDRYLEVEPRFVSEFGYQSFASNETLAQVVPEGHRNPTAPLMEHHQRHPNGNAHQLEQMADTFRVPFGFEDFVYLSQVQQGLAMKTAIEHWRRLQPYCMGTLYWQLNDLWPCASWSSIEYGGDWKALHHLARRFYAPVLVSVAPAEDGETFDVWVTNDRPTARTGRLSITVRTFDGKTLFEASPEVRIEAGGSRSVYSLEIDDLPRDVDPTRSMIRVDFDGDDETYANHAFFEPYKRLDLPDPDLDVTVADGTVTVEASGAALFVALSAPGVRFTDNYVHLEAGERASFEYEPVRIDPADAAGDADSPRETLSITHLRETYADQ
ncbi:beta-mannosidase [Halomontanus rarus]|uniref:beta-mannosidase n=1 Tax=Halomontanus rarus TaxID=3034020 RepID=UPI00293BD4F2|nr:sugar-binding domain-containing protein [Halovivax sp. KZCA124]